MTTPSTSIPAASSDDLRSNIANFMQRADRVAAHPLTGAPIPIMTIGPGPDDPGPVIDVQEPPEESWAYLALVLRPIVFIHQEPISIHLLTNAIRREHVDLRGALQPIKDAFTWWQTTVQFAFQDLGPADQPRHDQAPLVTGAWHAPVGTPLPDGSQLADMVTDYQLADVYLNGCLWHSDTQKFQKYQEATVFMKAIMAKSAELRTRTAAPFALALRSFITERRTEGYDF